MSFVQWVNISSGYQFAKYVTDSTSRHDSTAPAMAHHAMPQAVASATKETEYDEDFKRMITTLDFPAHMPFVQGQATKHRRLEDIIQDISDIMELCPVRSALWLKLASLKWSVGIYAVVLYRGIEPLRKQPRSNSSGKSDHQEQQHAPDEEIIRAQEKVAMTGSEHHMESLDAIVGGDNVELLSPEMQLQSERVYRSIQSARSALKPPQMVSSASTGDEREVSAGSVGPRNAKALFDGQKKAARHRCSICQKRFTRATTLREHARSHDNDRRYTCTSCPKSFVRLKDMKRHEATHSGSKPYACFGQSFGTGWGCGRSFAREDGLLAHFRTKAGWECIKAIGPRIVAGFIGSQIHSEVGPAGAFQCENPIRYSLQVKETAEHGRLRASHTSVCGRSFPTPQSFKSHLESDEGTKCLKPLVVRQAMNNSQRTAAGSPQWELWDSFIENRERSLKVTNDTAVQEEARNLNVGSANNVGRDDNAEDFPWYIAGYFFRYNDKEHDQVLSLMLKKPHRAKKTSYELKLRLVEAGNEHVWTCECVQTLAENMVDIKLPSLSEIESATLSSWGFCRPALQVMRPKSENWLTLGRVMYEEKAVEFAPSTRSIGVVLDLG